MRKLIAFLLFGGSVVAAWHYMHPQVDMHASGDAARSTAVASVPAASVAPHRDIITANTARAMAGTASSADAERSRTFSPNSPLFSPNDFAAAEPAPGSAQPARIETATTTSASPVTPTRPVTEAPTTTTPTAVVTVTSTPSQTASSDARRDLVRDIQKELKRVGCYDGDASGVWSKATSRAMGSFVANSNASLPSDKPDAAHLAMLKAEGAGRGCSNACGKGEVSAGSGICVTRQTIAARTPDAPRGAATNAAPIAGAMAIGGPKTEQRDDDGEISQSVANPPPAASDGSAPRSGSVIKAIPPPPAPVVVKQRTHTRSASSRDGTREVQDIFLHPLGR